MENIFPLVHNFLADFFPKIRKWSVNELQCFILSHQQNEIIVKFACHTIMEIRNSQWTKSEYTYFILISNLYYQWSIRFSNFWHKIFREYFVNIWIIPQDVFKLKFSFWRWQDIENSKHCQFSEKWLMQTKMKPMSTKM